MFRIVCDGAYKVSVACSELSQHPTAVAHMLTTIVTARPQLLYPVTRYQIRMSILPVLSHSVSVPAGDGSMSSHSSALAVGSHHLTHSAAAFQAAALRCDSHRQIASETRMLQWIRKVSEIHAVVGRQAKHLQHQVFYKAACGALGITSRAKENEMVCRISDGTS